MLAILNDYKIQTTDDTLSRAKRKVSKNKVHDEKTKAVAMDKINAFYHNDPKYFKTFIRLFGRKPPKKTQNKSENLTESLQRLGLTTKPQKQNNVNLAYTRLSDANLPMPKSPKTQRALNEAYAKITKRLQKNQSVIRSVFFTKA